LYVRIVSFGLSCHVGCHFGSEAKPTLAILIGKFHLNFFKNKRR